MLIRLVSHFPKNPKHVDKMIAIKGLPEDWIFRIVPEGKELKRPWTPDNEQNIPYDIRHLCEPTDTVFKYPPIQAGANGVIEQRKILGIVLDFMTEPGRELWDKIERYLEGTIPRTERVPEPVLLAKDEHSPFETYAPKKSPTGSIYLEPSPIPLIDLTLYSQPIVVKETVSPSPIKSVAQTPLEAPKLQSENFKCDKCNYTHKSPRGIRMHTMKRHPQTEKVGV